MKKYILLINFFYGPLCCMTVDEQLFKAAQIGDIVEVQKLLAHGANTDKIFQNNQTSLHAAARLGYLEVVEALLDAGADCCLKDTRGKNPLELCQELPFCGPLPTKTDRKKTEEFLLHYTYLFTQAQSQPTYAILQAAIEKGFIHLAKKLIIRLRPTLTHIHIYGTITNLRYEETKNVRYQVLKEVLKSYAYALRLIDSKILPYQSLPQELIDIIAHYSL